MTVNKWPKTFLILTNHNIIVIEIKIEIKSNFSLEKMEKSAEIVFVDSVKVDPNEFPDKYIKNIVKLWHNIWGKKKISTNIECYSCKGQLNFSNIVIESYKYLYVIAKLFKRYYSCFVYTSWYWNINY